MGLFYKQTKDYVRISYGEEGGKKSVIKVRNGYDLKMLDEVTGTQDGTNPVYGYDRIF